MTQHISSAAANLREDARRADGKFGTQQHSEADGVDLGLDASPVPRVDSQGHDWGPAFERFANPVRGERFELGYVGQGDGHTEEYICAQLSGSQLEIDELAELQELDWIETVEIRTYVDQELKSLGIDPDEAADEALYDDLMNAVSESPGAVPLEQLLEENTAPQLMRMQMFDGENLTDVNEDAYYDYDAQIEVIATKFKELGLDPETQFNRDAINTMVINGPEYWHDGVSLDVIWSGPYTNAVPAYEEKTLSFKDPHFVLIDTFNGSGWEAQAEGSIRRTIGCRGEDEPLPRTKRAYLDRHAGGYGWQSIAGVSGSAYETEVDVEQRETEPTEA